MGVYKAGVDVDGPKHNHFMVAPWSFLGPLFARTGFRILHVEDSELRYECLLEKRLLEEVWNVKGSIAALVTKRLEIGRGYV